MLVEVHTTIYIINESVCVYFQFFFSQIVWYKQCCSCSVCVCVWEDETIYCSTPPKKITIQTLFSLFEKNSFPIYKNNCWIYLFTLLVFGARQLFIQNKLETKEKIFLKSKFVFTCKENAILDYFFFLLLMKKYFILQ